MQIVQSIIVMFCCIKQTTEFSVCGPSVYHHLHGNPNAMATESHGPVLMVVPTLKTQHCIVNINKPITKTAAATLQIGIFKKPIASVQKEIGFYLPCKMFFSI